MNQKHALIIIAIIIVLIIGAGTLLLQNKELNKTLHLSNSATINVPSSNAQMGHFEDSNINEYYDEENGVHIFSWNSAESNNALAEAIRVSSLYNGIKGGTYEVIDGVNVYYNNGYYIINLGNNNTHDNILIMCKDKNLLIKIANTLHFNSNNSGDDSNTTSTTTTNHTNNISRESEDFTYDEDAYYYPVTSVEDSGSSSSPEPKPTPEG